MPDRPWTLLVVEAEPSEQRRLARCLEEDYQVLAATSGQNLARRAAATDLPVLIQGETGTGKGLMARAAKRSPSSPAIRSGGR